MGWFDGKSSASSSHSSRRRSPSRRSVYSTSHSRHSAPSVYSQSGYSRAGRSSPSVLSSSSSRRARPRDGFIQRIVHTIKRLFRDIFKWAREHPMKVLLVVIVPLLSSGVLQKLLGMIGIRLPHSLGGLGRLGSLGGLGGSSSSGARAGEGGFNDTINGAMKIAKMFM